MPQDTPHHTFTFFPIIPYYIEIKEKVLVNEK
jgi:hypothetical protein